MKRTKKNKKKQCFRTLVPQIRLLGRLVCENIVFLIFYSFQWFFVFLFLLVLQLFEQFFVFFIRFSIGFCYVFGVPPLVFHYFVGSRIGSERKTKGKLLENQSQPTPGPLRSFLLSLSLLWPPGLLWLALAVSFLSLASSTRDKEEIRRWGLSEASFWASPSSVFSLSRVTEREYSLGCTGPALGLSFLWFLLLSLLWGSFSGTSPASLLVVWSPLGSSGWLWLPPSSFCILLRVIK